MITDQTGSPRRIGTLPRSIWLPTLDADYSPDGLDTDIIDALIAECGLDMTAVDEVVEESYRDANPAPRPVGTTWTEAERRNRRRTVRRKTRSLDATAEAEPLTLATVTAMNPGKVA